MQNSTKQTLGRLPYYVCYYHASVVVVLALLLRGEESCKHSGGVVTLRHCLIDCNKEASKVSDQLGSLVSESARKLLASTPLMDGRIERIVEPKYVVY